MQHFATDFASFCFMQQLSARRPVGRRTHHPRLPRPAWRTFSLQSAANDALGCAMLQDNLLPTDAHRISKRLVLVINQNAACVHFLDRLAIRGNGGLVAAASRRWSCSRRHHAGPQLGAPPSAFLGGITGQFFRQFAVVISAAMLISAINAMTLTPARAAWIFGGRKPGEHGDQGKEALPWWSFALLGGLASVWLLEPILGPRLGLPVGGHSGAAPSAWRIRFLRWGMSLAFLRAGRDRRRVARPGG